jgi:hypothetical protein
VTSYAICPHRHEPFKTCAPILDEVLEDMRARYTALKEIAGEPQMIDWNANNSQLRLGYITLEVTKLTMIRWTDEWNASVSIQHAGR